jgi:hypothetical protein
MSAIVGHEYSISRIFSADFDFLIPAYQRPYAWTTEQAGGLFDDIMSYMEQQGAASDDPYFLGSIVLIKAEEAPRAEVIDGQQRLTTLTIMLSALAHVLGGDEGQALAAYINETGKVWEDIPAKTRLTLRDRDQVFFSKFIQAKDGIATLEALPDDELPDAQKRIRENAILLLNRLREIPTRKQQFDFGKFVVNRCYVVAVSTPNMQSAFRIFSVLNTRGLDLLPCDILKSEIIGDVPEAQRDAYTSKWEDVEENLGRDAFNVLFTHIRMIFQKAKLKSTVLEAFRKHVPEARDAPKLIDNIIAPYAEAFQIVTSAALLGGKDVSRVNEMLRWLKRMNNVDWIPPAILYVHLYKNGVKSLERLDRFLVALERLASSMCIRRIGVNERIKRYAKVIQAIQEDDDLWASASPLMLSEAEKEKTLEELDGDIYKANRDVRTYVMLRLDAFLADQAAVYNQEVLTVEHVLPQAVGPQSGWAAACPDETERS